jgi:hypothetical protein
MVLDKILPHVFREINFIAVFQINGEPKSSPRSDGKWQDLRAVLQENPKSQKR